MTVSKIVIRPRLKFLHSVYPEVVEYLTSIPPNELSLAIHSLLVRAVWDVTGRSHPPRLRSSAPPSDLAPVRSEGIASTLEGAVHGLAAFGVERGDTDAFDYS